MFEGELMEKIFLLLIVFLIQVSHASEFLLDNNIEKRNLIEDSFSKIDSIQWAEKEKISGFKAALYSAVLPGAGQYYAESYWRAALYATLEVAAWTTYFIYDAKGNKKDDEMRDYGDEHWSERKYWSKLYDEATTKNIANLPTFQTEISGDPLLLGFNSDMADQLRFLENELGYSHSLPSTHTQQYYEMIYKYPHQFAIGWDDSIFDNVYSPDASDLPNTARYYRNLRNLTEEYYDVATSATMAALVNHVISALDAALAAKAYNNSLKMKFTVNNKYLPSEKVKMYGFQFTW